MFLLITITAYSDEMNTISQNNKRSQKKNKRDRLEMIKTPSISYQINPKYTHTICYASEHIN